MPISKLKIPKHVIQPIGTHYHVNVFKMNPEYWSNYEIETVRAECGAEFQAIPVENVRAQLTNLRKHGHLGTTGKRKQALPAKREKPPASYLEYLKGDHWKTFRMFVVEFWDARCAWCNSPDSLDVHHRTYANLGHETITDCICLCRHCHRMADKSRQFQKNREQCS